MKLQALSLIRRVGTRYLWLALVAGAPACGDDEKATTDTRVGDTTTTRNDR